MAPRSPLVAPTGQADPLGLFVSRKDSAMYTIQKYGLRYYAVYDPAGELVCVTLYKKGAVEVVRRLTEKIP
jgi:hypothetical protein